VFQCPPDPLGLADETDDVHLSAAIGTDQRIDYPDHLDQSRQVGHGTSRELSITISISSTTCLIETGNFLLILGTLATLPVGIPRPLKHESPPGHPGGDS